MKKINIKVLEGEVEVNAHIMKNFAFHKSINSIDLDTKSITQSKYYYSITHIKSGLYVFNYIQEARACRAIINELNNLGFNWDVIESQSDIINVPQHVKDEVSKLRNLSKLADVLNYRKAV